MRKYKEERVRSGRQRSTTEPKPIFQNKKEVLQHQQRRAFKNTKYMYFKVGYCSKFCTVRALRFWNVRNFVGTGTFDRRSVLGFCITVLLNLAVLNLAPKCSKKPRTIRYFHFYFHLPMYQKTWKFDTAQVRILLSSESSGMFEGSSNIWGMFFE